MCVLKILNSSEIIDQHDRAFFPEMFFIISTKLKSQDLVRLTSPYSYIR